MAEITITPDGFETKTREDGEAIALILTRDSVERWTVYLSPTAAGLVGESLLRESGTTPHDASLASRLRPQQTLTLVGQSVRARAGGGAVLELMVQTSESGGVAIPVDLPPRDLAALMEALNKHR